MKDNNYNHNYICDLSRKRVLSDPIINSYFNGSNSSISYVDFICKNLLAYDNFKDVKMTVAQYKLYILCSLLSQQINTLCMNNSAIIEKV